jgi:2-phosphosulfolactate phosphatase
MTFAVKNIRLGLYARQRKDRQDMKVQILELIEGAKRAEGLTVIIDVFRAFTTECYCFDGGAVKSYPIGSMEAAFALKKAHPDWVLLGERGGAKVEGCDLGNSPWDASNYDFRGKTMIHSTSAGTLGIVNAANARASEIVTGSLVNARAVCEYIRLRDPEVVSLVAMGKAGLSPVPEDLLAARYMQWMLEHEAPVKGGTLPKHESSSDDVVSSGYGLTGGRGALASQAQAAERRSGIAGTMPASGKFDIDAEVAYLKDHGGQQFFDPALAHIFPREDYALCTAVDRFDFVLRVSREEDALVIRRLNRQ